MSTGIDAQGRVVDPQAFFFTCVQRSVFARDAAPGRSAAGWQQALADPAFADPWYAASMGQQKSSGGEPRARVFEPHVECPADSHGERSVAPRTNAEKRLGVRQPEPGESDQNFWAWRLFADVVDDRTQTWIWAQSRGPAYAAPLAQHKPDEPPKEPVSADVEKRLAALEAADTRKNAEIAALKEAVAKLEGSDGAWVREKIGHFDRVVEQLGDPDTVVHVGAPVRVSLSIQGRPFSADGHVTAKAAPPKSGSV